MGITINTLSNYRGHQVSKEDVKNLTKPEAAEIYKKLYWNICKCGDMPAPVALLVFDAAVNSGTYRSVMFLQRALGIPDDGKCGNMTLSAIKNADQYQLVKLCCGERLKFLRLLKTFDTFGKGWTNRVNMLEGLALSWIK